MGKSDSTQPGEDDGRIGHFGGSRGRPAADRHRYNGSACIRLLAGQSPNVEEALEALRDIVRDGKRAGEVIARIRAMTKRAATPRERVRPE